MWREVRLLLGVRSIVLRRSVAESPNGLLWTLLLASAVATVALSRGSQVASLWANASSAAGQSTPPAELELQRLWMLVQGFWLVMLLVPGGLTLLGRTPARAILRPFALSTNQLLVAETLAGLMDLPGALAILVMLPLLGTLITSGQWLVALISICAFLLLALHTGLLARLFTLIGQLVWRGGRRLAEVPGVASLMLCVLCIAMPPVLAALTTPSAYVQKVSHLVDTHSVTGSISPSIASESVRLLPASLAAQAAFATQMGTLPGALGSLTILIGILLMTGLATSLAAHHLDRMEMRATHTGGIVPRASSNRQLKTRDETRPRPLRALLIAELRLLLRAPQTYLPLRKPASLLMLCCFAFLAPDMSKSPLYNLKEYLGIGGILFTLLWQLQFLCNRFGNETGTSDNRSTVALLFGFSISRRVMLFGKNLALLLLLLLLDAPMLAVLALVADAPGQIPNLLLWLPMILLTLTTLGNLVTARFPFPIAHTARNLGQEPPDSLIGIYLSLIVATILIVLPVGWFWGYGVVGGLLSWIYLVGIYVGSLAISVNALECHESRIFEAL